jgi:hypothetical protein
MVTRWFRFQPIEVTWRSLAKLTELELNNKGQFVKKPEACGGESPAGQRAAGSTAAHAGRIPKAVALLTGATK